MVPITENDTGKTYDLEQQDNKRDHFDKTQYL